MTKLVTILMSLCFVSVSFGEGGMIGGGEVTFKSLLECQAAGIDPTHAGPSYASVGKEVDFDGNIIKGSTLRIVTSNENREPIAYYVTHQTELAESPDHQVNLALWRYEVGSAGNSKVGRFQVDIQSGSGSMYANIENEITELQLTNCVAN